MSISFWPAIQQIVGGISGSPTPIVRDSQWTIVVVDTTPGVGTTNLYAELPTGADIGDLVEVLYLPGGNTPQISAGTGDTIVGGIASGPRFFRKIDTNLWCYL